MSNTVSVYVGARFAGIIKGVGNGPTGIAVNSTATRAYVVDYGFFNRPSHTVTPINLASGRAMSPIAVGTGPLAIAIAPGNRFSIVTLQGDPSHPGHQVREINLLTRAVSAPVNVGVNPESVTITPDGTMAYVGDFSSAAVTPLDLTVWPPRALAPIRLPGASPRAIAISPDGRTAYVLDTANATVIPIDLATRTIGQPLDLVCRQKGDPGCTPSAIVISPDGRTAYVAAAGSGDVVMVSLPALTVAGILETGAYPDAVGLGQGSLFVGNGASNTMSIFAGLGAPQTVGGVLYPFGVAVVPGAPALRHLSSGSILLAGPGARPVLGPAPPSPFYGL